MLFVAVLALSAATSGALAAPSRISKRDGSFTIPIKKVDSFTYKGVNQFSGDGLSVADRLTKLQVRVSNTQNKYRHLNKNPKKQNSKRANSTLQMGDGPGDFYYFGTIALGNPAVAFELQLDTGSADLIVMSNPCYSGCEQGTTLYRPSDSSSAVVSNTPFSIQYGSGDANGILVTDNVQFGGFALNQTFGALRNSNGIYHAGGGINGILGLAWGAIAQSGATPFIQQLWQNNILDQPLFAMAFARWETGAITPGGSMSIGAVNPNLFSGSISYTPSSSNSYWVIPLDDITVSGKALNTSTPNALIDTGTSLIYIPQSVAKTFYATIPGSYEAGSGIYVYPCSSVVNAQFKFSGINWAVSDRDFNLGSAGGSMCYAGVAYLQGVDLWILGDVFLKNVYSVFRFNPSSIGFATLSDPNQLLQGYVPVGNGTSVANGANNTSILSKSTTSAAATSSTIVSVSQTSNVVSDTPSSSSPAVSAAYPSSSSPSVTPSTPTPSSSLPAPSSTLATTSTTQYSTVLAESHSPTSVPTSTAPSVSDNSTIISSSSTSSITSVNSAPAGVSPSVNTSSSAPSTTATSTTTTATSITTSSTTSVTTPAISSTSAIATTNTSSTISTASIASTTSTAIIISTTPVSTTTTTTASLNSTTSTTTPAISSTSAIATTNTSSTISTASIASTTSTAIIISTTPVSTTTTTTASLNSTTSTTTPAISSTSAIATTNTSSTTSTASIASTTSTAIILSTTPVSTTTTTTASLNSTTSTTTPAISTKPTTSTTATNTTTSTTPAISTKPTTSTTTTATSTSVTSKSSSSIAGPSVGGALPPKSSPAATSSTSSSTSSRASSLSSTSSPLPGAERPTKSITSSTTSRTSSSTSAASITSKSSSTSIPQSSTVTSTSTTVWFSRGRLYTSTGTGTYTTLTPTATDTARSEGYKHAYRIKCQVGRDSTSNSDYSWAEEYKQIDTFFSKKRSMSYKEFWAYMDSIKCT